MNTGRPSFFVVAAAIAAGAVAFPAAQQADSIPVPLSDPARPATVSVEMMNGAIIVRGETRKDVLVTATSGPEDATPRRGRGARGRISPTDPSVAGLKQLNQRAGFEITEQNNIVSIESDINRGGDIEVRVPTRTNLKLEGLNGSGITVENVDGDIEAEHLNGSIRLTNVSGSVVAESHNGNVNVVLTRIASEKAMSFVSFNGNVDVTLPASAKANVRLRSDQGDIFTDFDVQIRPTAVQPQKSNRGFKVEVNQAIFGAINGGGPEFQLQTFNGSIFLRRGK